MVFSVFTYNVLFNQGYVELEHILCKVKADILCLQEIETNEFNLKKLELSGYKLADYSNSFIRLGKIYGVATFYNPQSFHHVKSSFISLPQSFYELFLSLIRGVNKPRTVLRTDFIHKLDNKKITTYNVHLTPTGANGARIKQLKETLSDLTIALKHPVVIAGDFNYPFGRRKLEEVTRKYHFKEATSNLRYTYSLSKKENELDYKHFNFLQKVLITVTNSRIFKKLLSGRYKLDYIFYRGVKLVKTERIDIVALSDHYPIISYFNFV